MNYTKSKFAVPTKPADADPEEFGRRWDATFGRPGDHDFEILTGTVTGGVAVVCLRCKTIKGVDMPEFCRGAPDSEGVQ